jgi:hypothetical protein
MYRSVLTLGVLTLALAPPAGAEEAREKVKGLQIKAERQPYTSAAKIDFAASLELPFPSLTTLGGRIEAARSAPDPVGLAASASELSVAEKVSGKKAALTGEGLWKEAADLAELRGHSNELKALALMTTGDAQKKLTLLAKKAEKDEVIAARKAEIGDIPRGIERRLVVNNFSPHGYRIFVNGRSVGYVRARSTESFPVHTHGRTTTLMAEGEGGRWPYVVSGEHETWVWTLVI